MKEKLDGRKTKNRKRFGFLKTASFQKKDEKETKPIEDVQRKRIQKEDSCNKNYVFVRL